jgi:anti-sigma B factor antagonist
MSPSSDAHTREFATAEPADDVRCGTTPLTSDAIAGFDPPFALSQTRPASATAVIEIVGGVDMSTAPRLAEFLEAQRTAAVPAVVIDLSGVTFLGSAGLSVLVDEQCRVESTGGTLLFVTGPHCVERALQVTGLDRKFRRYATVTAALAAAANDVAVGSG